MTDELNFALEKLGLSILGVQRIEGAAGGESAQKCDTIRT